MLLVVLLSVCLCFAEEHVSQACPDPFCLDSCCCFG